MPRTSFFVDGLNVYHFQASAPRYAVLILHGTGGHGGCYDVYGEAHSAQGVDVYAMDFPNHGRSRGVHGTWTMEDCMASIDTVAQHIKAEMGLPVFLLGSSQGSAFAWYGLNTSDAVTGAITLCLAAFHLSPFRGVIEPLRSDEFVAAMNFFRGSLQIDLKKFMRIEENYGSKEVTDRLLADPDMTWVYDLATYRELLLWEPSAPAAKNSKPLFVTVGEHDPFMSPAVVKMIADQIGGPVTYREFKGAPHQVMLERTEEFIVAVDEWVAQVS